MEDLEITKVPIAGGSGRVPSGVMQFENDWKGVFLRGDYCMFLKMELEKMLSALEENDCKVYTEKVNLLMKMIDKAIE